MMSQQVAQLAHCWVPVAHFGVYLHEYKWNPDVIRKSHFLPFAYGREGVCKRSVSEPVRLVISGMPCFR